MYFSPIAGLSDDHVQEPADHTNGIQNFHDNMFWFGATYSRHFHEIVPGWDQLFHQISDEIIAGSLYSVPSMLLLEIKLHFFVGQRNFNDIFLPIFVFLRVASVFKEFYVRRGSYCRPGIHSVPVQCFPTVTVDQ